MASVEDLVRSAQGGDSESLSELLEYLESFVGNRIRRRAGAALLREHGIEDLCQETYQDIVRSLSGFEWRDDARFTAWVYTIADRVCARIARKRRLGMALDLGPEAAGSDVSPSREVRREERLERLKRTIEELPDPYRDAIRLVRLEGLRVADAAERLGKSEVAVRQLISRGLKKMRESFGDTVSLGLPDTPIELDVSAEDERRDDLET